MRSSSVKNILRFIMLAALQIVVFNNMQVGTFVNIFIYTGFILFLPFETPKSLMLLLALVMGLLMDMFSNTGGLHAASLVFMAFCRPGVLRVIAPRDGYDSSGEPTIAVMGLGWFVTYALLLITAQLITAKQAGR